MSTVPDTIPDNIMEIGVSELTIEQMQHDREMPCEISGHFWNKCKSEGKLPATWMISHEGAQPKCTFLVCEPCVAHLQQWIAECIVRGGARNFGCNICDKSYFHYTEFITRQL
jgi:hypothetical protein